MELRRWTASKYIAGATVTVLGNTGNLVNAGYTFAGWNTERPAAAASTFYAAGRHLRDGWPTPRSTPHGRPNDRHRHLSRQRRHRAAPSVDAPAYLTGATVTVLGNTGSW